MCKKNPENVSSFNRNEQKIDDFYFNEIKDLSDDNEFYNILELVFVLSHGRTDIDRGFSLNRNILKQNMEAIASRCQIKDYLLCNETNLNTYTIPSKMLESVQLSRKEYEVYLQENKS